MTRHRASLISFAAIAAMSMAGCQHLDLYQKYRLSKLPQDSLEHPVREVIALWEPAEGTGLDGAPCRGFAGQVLFFAHGFNEPVRVGGDVTIYVFDDQGTNEEQSRPLHTFKFEGGSWEAYLRGTNTLGATYQIFIPYTRDGAHQATCTLRVKYEPKGGIPIYSKMASIILAGTVDDPENSSAAEPNNQPNLTHSDRTTSPVQQPSFEELKQFAQEKMQQVSKAESTSPVLTMPHPQSADLGAERQRLQRQVQSMLQELAPPTEQPARQPWDPINRTIVPKPITPDQIHHPLQE